jgi:hypothetical protein
VGHKHVPESELIQFRVSRELAAGLSAAALEQEVSRSEYLRRLTEQVLSGELVVLPDLLDEDAEVDLAGLSRRSLAVLDERLKAGGKGLPGTGLMNLVERFLRVEEEKQRENEARNPDPARRYEDDRVGEQDLYESMVGMHEREALSPARMKELFLDIGTKSAAAAQEFLTYGEQIPDEEVSSNGTVATDVG